MSELFDRWLSHYDTIHRGWTPLGIANGMTATNGFAFPRVMGGYNLYRGPVAGGDSSTVQIVGAAGASATVVETFAWAPAMPLDFERFELRSIGGGGAESTPSTDGIAVQFDSLGQVEPLKPNSPGYLGIEQGAGGSFLLTWRYSQRGQEVAPAGFEVFADNASGIIDFANAAGVLAYRPRQGSYSYITGPHAHGSVQQFSVRAVAFDGTHDGNTLAVAAWADALPPAVPPVLLTEIIEAS